VNFIWLCSIIGIVCAIIPFVGFMFSPVMEVLTRFFTHKILPVFRIFEESNGSVFLAFLICFWLEVHGLRYPSETGFYVSLTGCLLAIPGWFYAGRHAWAKSIEYQNLVHKLCLCGFLFLVWVPMAILLDSKLLGFLAMACFYYSMGFGVEHLPDRLGYRIGFEDESSLIRVVCSSAIIIIASILFKCFGLTRHRCFSPFSTAFNTLGPITYFLGLLIESSVIGNFWRIMHGTVSMNWLMAMNALMIASIVLTLAVSYPLNIIPLRNTALVFAVLYVTDKPCFFWTGDRCVVFVMSFFVALWQISLFLHSHPDFITDMFDSSWISASN